MNNLSWSVNIIVMWQIAIDGVSCTLPSEIEPYGWQLYLKKACGDSTVVECLPVANGH